MVVESNRSMQLVQLDNEGMRRVDVASSSKCNQGPCTSINNAFFVVTDVRASSRLAHPDALTPLRHDFEFDRASSLHLFVLCVRRLCLQHESTYNYGLLFTSKFGNFYNLAYTVQYCRIFLIIIIFLIILNYSC